MRPRHGSDRGGSRRDLGDGRAGGARATAAKRLAQVGLEREGEHDGHEPSRSVCVVRHCARRWWPAAATRASSGGGRRRRSAGDADDLLEPAAAGRRRARRRWRRSTARSSRSSRPAARPASSRSSTSRSTTRPRRPAAGSRARRRRTPARRPPTTRTIGYIGEFNSGATAVSLPILNEAGVPQVSPGNTAVGITSDDPGAEPGEPDKYYPTRRAHLRARAARRTPTRAPRWPRWPRTRAAPRPTSSTTRRSTARAWPRTSSSRPRPGGLEIKGDDGIDKNAANYRSLGAEDQAHRRRVLDLQRHHGQQRGPDLQGHGRGAAEGAAARARGRRRDRLLRSQGGRPARRTSPSACGSRSRASRPRSTRPRARSSSRTTRPSTARRTRTATPSTATSR